MKGWSFKSCFFLIPLLLISACSSTPSQISGVVAIANFATTACVPQMQVIQFRNNDTTQAQRVQGVFMEFGTNDFDPQGNKVEVITEETKFTRYFKVIDAVVNGNTIPSIPTPTGEQVQEVIIPPGGVMAINVSYNPRAVTKEDAYHNTYLDIMLNGPKYGVMQIELRGKAATAAPNCGVETGQKRTFEVVSLKTILNDVDLNPNPAETDLDISTQVGGDFEFVVDGDKISLPKDGWPRITLEAPGQGPIPVLLNEDSPEGTFVNGELTIEGLVLNAAIVSFTNVILTTGDVSAQAADIEGGTLSLSGENFDSTSREMTLVVAIPLTGSAFQPYSIFNGAFGAVITLREKTQ